MKQTASKEAGQTSPKPVKPFPIKIRIPEMDANGRPICREGFRIEEDSVGPLEIPETAYYGIESLRGALNFPITGHLMHPVFIRNLAKIKKACAISNYVCQVLNEERMQAILQACDEVISGKLNRYFIVDEIQGGAGTSANMNANEVIANRASEILSGRIGDPSVVHPLDHVNRSQSTNDVYPTAGRLTALDLMDELFPTLEELKSIFLDKSIEFAQVYKIGRTQLQDAVPMRLGQSFMAYAHAVDRDLKHLREAYQTMLTINLGGTAIGTSANAPSEYVRTVVPELSNVTGHPLRQAEDLIDATQNLSDFVFLSGAIKAAAVTLSKISNDLRLLSSGPRAGFGEIKLPPVQNGSSIMPGKINPVIPEVVNQVCFAIVGNDTTISMAVEAGQLELNAFEPVLFSRLFNSIYSLRTAIQTLSQHCVRDIEARQDTITNLLNRSLYGATALSPKLGYDKSSALAKKALLTNKSIREVALEEGLLTEEELDQLLDVRGMVLDQLEEIEKARRDEQKEDGVSPHRL